MRLNRADLRKILYDFNSISNRLLQADHEDHTKVVGRFIAYIKATPIIYDYILECGVCDQDMDDEFNQIRKSYGRCIFDLGNTDEEEIRNVFAILNYITENSVDVSIHIAEGYTDSNIYQDRTKAFNDRVVMVLIRHIERYLTKVGIDMGIDEKITYSITFRDGQLNIAHDNATINATNTISIDWEKLTTLINDVKSNATGITGEEAETLADSLEVIEEQVKEDKPKKGFIRTAITGLKAIHGTAEFVTAVAELVEFLQVFL